MELELATVPFIILCVYFLVYLIKCLILKTDNQRKALPPIAMVLGAAIAIALYIFMPDTVSFANIIEASTDGMASGLAAVGCNQVKKQFQKFNSTDDNSDEESV